MANTSSSDVNQGAPIAPMEQHTMQIRMEGLIDLLAKNLYADPNVFVREMVQNAHDAIVKRKLVSRERDDFNLPGPEIRIYTDRQKRTLSFADNGAGLTASEIHEYLSTIGNSDKPEYRERVKRLAESEHHDVVQMIGQFGIGLLSGFIVASEIELVTKTAGGDAYQWRSAGDLNYYVSPAQRAAVGTTVILSLKPEHERYLDRSFLTGIIKTYADIIGIPIFLDDDNRPVNHIDAPWHRTFGTKQEEQESNEEYWRQRFPDQGVLDLLPVREEFSYTDTNDQSRTSTISGVLGITEGRIPGVNTRGTVDLFLSRIFIASGVRNVLPTWASFIQGVVECGDFMPNAARDNIIPNSALEAARDVLGQAVMRWLEAMSLDHPIRFREIIDYHSFQILAMCLLPEHKDFFLKVADILPLDSDAGLITMQDYIKTAVKQPDDRRRVYYIADAASASQSYMLCKARGLHVFNAGTAFVESFLRLYEETWNDRIQLQRLDVSSTDIFEPVVDLQSDKYLRLEALYAAMLPIKAKVSRFKPEHIPVLLIKDKDSVRQEDLESVANDPRLPTFLRKLVQEAIGEKRDPVTLHLNADNPIIDRLATRLRTGNDEITRHALLSLYNNAVMLHSRNITPDNIELMFSQYNQVIDILLSTAETNETWNKKYRELELKFEAERNTISLSRCVTCFVAMPFNNPAMDAVFHALEMVLEDGPFFWNIIRADDRVDDARLWKNVEHKMARAHCFIAEVSENNPNVMIEIGRMEAFNRPVLLLKRKDAPPPPADLRERLYVNYDATDSETLKKSLHEEILKNPIFCDQKGELYLSPIVLEGTGLQRHVCQRLIQQYETIGDFIKADPQAAAERIGLDTHLFVAGAQDALQKRLRQLGHFV